MEERITLGDSATPLVLIGGGLATALSPSLGEASPAVAEEQSNSFQSTFVVQPEESEVPEISTNQEAATRQQVRAQRSTVDPPQTEVLPAVLDELLSSPLHEPVATAQAGIESPELPVTEIQKAEPRGSFVPASNANTGSPAPTGDGEVASFGSGTLSAQATVAPIPTQHSEIQSLQIESQSEPAADSGSSIDTGGKFFVTSFGGGENEEPSADEDEYSVLHDTTLTVSAPGVMDNDSDPDSDPIFAVLDAGPSNGSLNYFNSDGSFEYVPNANWTGFDAFTYHVNDGLDDSDIATVTIDVANEDPWADDDEYSVLHDTTLVVSSPGVMDNDGDLDSDPISAELDVGPTNGTLTYFNSDGSFECVPNTGWSGIDTFTYQVNDGLEDGDIAEVEIDVTNEIPWAEDDEYGMLRDTTLTVSSPGVLDNDGDNDSDPISAALDVGPSNGTLTYFNSDGSFEYVPNAGWSGIDSFTYYVNDGLEDSDTATVTINVNDVTLHWVTFKNEHEITADPPPTGMPTLYDTQHWLDDNLDGDAADMDDHKWPVAYTRNTTMEISSVEFVLDQAWNGGQIQVKADGPGNIDIPAKIANVNGTKVTLANVAADNAFPNTIKHYDDFELAWKLSTDGGTTWINVGTSSNDLYLTLGKPDPNPLYHTVVHIGSHEADGENDPDDAVSEIWAEFSDRVVKRMDGTQLKYWDGGAATATDTEGLLRDANGQCGSWAEFLIDTIEAQGITADKILVLNNDQQVGQPLDYGLLVKNWNFIMGAGSSPGTAPYVYTLDGMNPDATPQAGAAGQGNANPPSDFYNHFVVKYDGKYYDPSYGNGPYATQAAWENASLDGFFKELAGGGAVAKKNDLNVVETSFTVV